MPLPRHCVPVVFHLLSLGSPCWTTARLGKGDLKSEGRLTKPTHHFLHLHEGMRATGTWPCTIYVYCLERRCGCSQPSEASNFIHDLICTGLGAELKHGMLHVEQGFHFSSCLTTDIEEVEMIVHGAFWSS